MLTFISLWASGNSTTSCSHIFPHGRLEIPRRHALIFFHMGVWKFHDVTLWAISLYGHFQAPPTHTNIPCFGTYPPYTTFDHQQIFQIQLFYFEFFCITITIFNTSNSNFAKLGKVSILRVFHSNKFHILESNGMFCIR